MKPDMMDRVPEYVLGALPEDEAREVEALLATSPALRREVERVTLALAESAAGALDPIAPSDKVRARLVKTLAGPDRFQAFFATLCRLADLPLEALRKQLARVDEAGGWETGPAPDIRIIHFQAGPSVAAADAGFLRMTAGSPFPRHRHLGQETTVVLEGTIHDGGRVYGPGEVIVWALGTVHEYSAGPGRELLVMVVHSGIEPAK